jgi:general secretion pathway protein I
LSRGFTLVEMLVAFVVLALSLGALMPLVASAARQSAVLQDYARAVTLADSLLAAAGEGEALRPGVASGSENHLRWRRSVEPEVPPGHPPDARWVPCRVSVEVHWGSGSAARTVRVATLRLGVRE